MVPQKETAAPTGIGSGGDDNSKGLTTRNYRNSTDTATDFAVAFVARRFRISLTRARIICDLAQIGGRAA